MQTRVKTESEIKNIRESGRMLATVLSVCSQRAAAGMSTKELADIAAAELKGLGGKPAFYGYGGFPDVMCISVNDEVVHGIPRSDKILADGDILGMDFGVLHGGMITDSATTIFVGGEARNKREKMLVDVTRTALQAGIDSLHDGVRVGDIGAAVQEVLDNAGLGIVRELVGHGVGHELHEEPNVPNYGKAGTGQRLQAGMTIAIEPMATLGDHKIAMREDEWTIVTRDGSRSAHFEHTVLITQDGAEIITRL
ncbi:type I methionyl aminopeptidase [Candidatus Saccharibacteria bacterium]|nr:MAG: type I methionyl aminopeptidase [Candidatus Saccharibacteria bacterium]